MARRGGVDRAQQDVAAGKQYRVAGSSLSLWEVVEMIKHPGSRLEHVRIAKVRDPSDVKTVSLKVLKDRRFYEPAGDSQAGAEYGVSAQPGARKDKAATAELRDTCE